MNDPKIAAVVGDYEEWPEFDIEKGCGPLLVGSEGCWPGLGDPILWKEIASLHVDRDIFGVVVADGLGAVTGPTSLSPETAVRKVLICMGSAGQAFDDRARLVADRLQRYFLDRGVPSPQWPNIDLTPGPAERAF
jgi:hypothetical protein